MALTGSIRIPYRLLESDLSPTAKLTWGFFFEDKTEFNCTEPIVLCEWAWIIGATKRQARRALRELIDRGLAVLEERDRLVAICAPPLLLEDMPGYRSGVRYRKPLPTLVLAKLKARDGTRCLCCGLSEGVVKLVADHVVPFSKGGSDDISNLQLLCVGCNTRKGATTIDYRPKATTEENDG